MVDVLLTTKLLIPPLRPNLIARDHLTSRLNASSHKLVLISAPAGFGKTTLAGVWCRQAETNYAWLSLDEADNDPHLFLHYLVTALIRANSDFGECVDEEEDGVELDLFSVAARLLNRAACISRQTMLILDDYQAINNPQVHHLLTYLIDRLPSQLQLMLLTRGDPAGLPLVRLRARNEMLELRTDDLRFSPDETNMFLSRCMGLNLKPNEVLLINQRTEGWVAGLQLAALSLHGEVTPEFLQSLGSSESHIGEYLLQEVLDRQPEEVQRFLLQTSVLENISADLVQVLTGQADGQAILHRLDQANLFIFPLDHNRQWYRYHPLFRDLLRQQIQRRWSVEEYVALHNKAADWYEHNGMVEEAIQHALLGGQFDKAANLIEATYETALWKRGEIGRLRSQLKAFPPEFIHQRPRLALLHSGVLMVSGDFQEAEHCLRISQEQSPKGDLLNGLAASFYTTQVILSQLHGEGHEADPLPENNPLLQALMQFNLGMTELKSGRLVAARQAMTEAMRQAEENENVLLRMFCLYWLGMIEFEGGRLKQSRSLCEEALRIAECYGEAVHPLTVMQQRGYAEILYEFNDLEGARGLYEKCVEGGEQHGLSEVVTSGLIGRARLALLRGDENRVQQILQQARRWTAEYSTAAEVRRMSAMWANLMLRHGDLLQAAGWVSSCGLSLNDPFTSLDGFFFYSVLVRYWISYARLRKDRSNLPRVLSLLDRMDAAASASECTSLVIRIRILQALAQDTFGHLDASMTALKEALELSESGGYVRTYLDEGPAMLNLLRRAAQRGYCPVYVRHLIEEGLRAGPIAVQDPAILTTFQRPQNSLTERESEVLVLIAAGLSNEEIAAQLVVTINTVRTHIKSINRKFGVRSRTQAVYQAQRMGLLSAS